MGEYTQLVLGVDFKQDTPPLIITRLMQMTGEMDPAGISERWFDIPATAASDEFFSCSRAGMLLGCDSAYFDWASGFKVTDNRWTTEEHHEWNLTGCSNLKNYSGEIAKFLAWICPYIETRGFLGIIRQEGQEVPTIISKTAGEGLIEFYTPPTRSGEGVDYDF